MLTEQGEKEAQAFLDNFKLRMSKLVDEVMSEAYVDCMPYIESDSWLNFRNAAISWVQGYKELSGYDASAVREAILKNHREQIINDLNQDHLKRIKWLEEALERERDLRRRFQ